MNDELREALLEEAKRLGLMMVKQSPRRYMVVECWGVVSYRRVEGVYFALHGGEVIARGLTQAAAVEEIARRTRAYRIKQGEKEERQL